MIETPDPFIELKGLEAKEVSIELLLSSWKEYLTLNVSFKSY